LTGQQYGALSKGYSEALKGALDEAQLQNLAAGTQGKLAQQELDTGLTAAGALTKAGAERQAYQQSLLDQPLKTATTASGLMRGFTVPQTQTSTFVGPKAGSYQKSDLEQMMGVLSLLGSAAGGQGIKTAASAGTSLYDWLKGKFGTGGFSGFDANALPNSMSVNDYDAAINGWVKQPDGSYVDSEGNPV